MSLVACATASHYPGTWYCWLMQNDDWYDNRPILFIFEFFQVLAYTRSCVCISNEATKRQLIIQ